jgi:hypothetical protein
MIWVSIWSGQHRLAAQFLLRDELQQHAARDVVAAAILDDANILAGGNQLAHIILVDVPARLRIVETPVSVLANDS